MLLNEWMGLYKEEKNTLFRISNRLNCFIKKVDNHYSEWNDMLFEIKRNYKKIRSKEKEKVLRKLSIDVLTKHRKNIPVKKLRRYRYHNLHQIMNMTKRQLLSIRGIGEVSSRLIQEALRRIDRNVEENLTVSLNDYFHMNETTTLLENIRTILEFNKRHEEVEEFYRNESSDLKKYSFFLNKHRKFPRRIFLLKKKKAEIKTLLNQLEVLLGSEEFIGINDFLDAFNDRSCVHEDLQGHFIKNNIDYYTIIEDIMGRRYAKNIDNSGLDEEQIQKIQNVNIDFSYFEAKLRKYQHFGAQFLLHRRRVLLGDDMGLGKTVQTLSVMAHLKAKGRTHFFVIAPLSVMIHWKRETIKHTQLDVCILHGQSLREKVDCWKKNGGIGITTYDTAKKIQVKQIKKIDYLVVDEAHYIKNPESQRSECVKEFIDLSYYVTLMTGTPIENEVQEMINLIAAIDYRARYRIDTEIEMINPQLFRKEISSIYLRRTRDEVLSELPDLTIANEWTFFKTSEYQRYKRGVSDHKFQLIRRIGWLEESSSKMDRLIELYKEAQENNRKVVIYSYFLDVIDRVYNKLNNDAFEPITGSMSSPRRQTVIDKFHKSNSKNVLIAQITTGGHGINLQNASVVIICEPQIKPSMESQAIARVYRMGQTRGVLVYRLLTQNSVDEYILSILDKKTEIFNTYANKSFIAEMVKKHQTKKLEDYIIRQEQNIHLKNENIKNQID